MATWSFCLLLLLSSFLAQPRLVLSQSTTSSGDASSAVLSSTVSASALPVLSGFQQEWFSVEKFESLSQWKESGQVGKWTPLFDDRVHPDVSYTITLNYEHSDEPRYLAYCVYPVSV